LPVLAPPSEVCVWSLCWPVVLSFEAVPVVSPVFDWLTSPFVTEPQWQPASEPSVRVSGAA